MAAEHGEDVFHHVRDFPHFELPHGVELQLPSIHLPLLGEFQITKFMVLQLVAFGLALAIFVPLARRVRTGAPAPGRWFNFWEMIAVFLRDQVVRPTIGDDHHHGHVPHADEGTHRDDTGHEVHATPQDVFDKPLHTSREGEHLPTGSHPADRYLPFVWSAFFYILFANLLGAVPWMGSPTGHLAVTGMLAACTFGYVVLTGSTVHGPAGFWLSLVPSMDVPRPVGVALVPMVWVIEVLGLLIRHGVLAMRLFANIMAGHTVIAVILAFIAQAAGSGLWWVVTPASIAGQVAIGLLELFVAFLQAYIFAFLSTLFISMARHAH